MLQKYTHKNVMLMAWQLWLHKGCFKTLQHKGSFKPQQHKGCFKTMQTVNILF